MLLFSTQRRGLPFIAANEIAQCWQIRIYETEGKKQQKLQNGIFLSIFFFIFPKVSRAQSGFQLVLLACRLKCNVDGVKK